MNPLEAKIIDLFSNFEQIEGLMLFGSHFSLTSKDYSDIDLIVFQDTFVTDKLPTHLDKTPIDFKILNSKALPSCIFEKSFHTLRIAADYKQSKLLSGRRPLPVNQQMEELDFLFKIIANYLSFDLTHLNRNFIDSPRTLAFGKKSYRKLSNLIKTVYEITPELISDYSHIKDLNAKLNEKIPYNFSENVFSYKDVKTELTLLLKRYIAFLEDHFLKKDFHHTSPRSIDPIWKVDFQKDFLVKGYFDKITKEVVHRWKD